VSLLSVITDEKLHNIRTHTNQIVQALTVLALIPLVFNGDTKTTSKVSENDEVSMFAKTSYFQ